MAAKKILVCDSDNKVIHLVRSHFENLGCDVTQAHSASQAATSLRRDDFDLIILDLFMAKTNGDALLRSIEKGHCVPKIAMVSAEDDGDQIRFGREVGADYYLAKPLLNADLARLVTIL